MEPSNDYNNKLPIGKVRYGKSVLRSIISLAIQEISGVASLHGNGFRIFINGNYVDLDVFIDVHFGISCSEVAFKVQENIKSSVETMSKYKMRRINISIIEVEFQERIANAL